MALNVQSFFYQQPLRNWSYLIWESSSALAWAIDPYNGSEILAFLQKNNLKLQAILNTHEHWDHIQGNQNIFEATGCEIWASGDLQLPHQSKNLRGDEILHLSNDHEIKSLHIPGHTTNHFGFYLSTGQRTEYLFSGDTLFNAGVGNCKNGGNPEVLFETVTRLKKFLPDHSVLYPGHDYRENNTRFFCEHAPPKWIDNCEAMLDASQFPQMIHERKVNLFLRCDEVDLQSHLQQKFHTGKLDEKACFLLLRKLRDNF